jgi:hypothetical protein
MRAETAMNSNQPEPGDLDRAALDRLGIGFTFHEGFNVDKIDEPASRMVWNQARLGDPVDERHVETLRAELERGVELPPIIVYRDQASQWVTLSGNHRVRAYQLEGRRTIQAYEATGLAGLRVEDPRVLLLVYEANHGHGKAVDLDDRLEQGLSLIAHGKSIRAAAAALGVPEGRLRDHYEASRATHRLEEDLGVATDEIPISAQRRLANIRSDRVAKAAAAVVPLMDRKTSEVNELVKAVNLERTEEAQLAVVKDYEATLQSRPRDAERRRQSPQVPPDIRRLDTALGTIIRFEVESLRSGVPSELRDRLKERTREAIGRLGLAEELL